jgi:hypothetical protein
LLAAALFKLLLQSQRKTARALTQEVAYNSVLAERRRVIHDQTARAMEMLYASQLEPITPNWPITVSTAATPSRRSATRDW